MNKEARVHRELLQSDQARDFVFEDELTKELLACEGLCQLLDIAFKWTIQSTTLIRIAAEPLVLFCQLLVKVMMQQGQLCRQIRLSTAQQSPGSLVLIHFDSAAALPDWQQNSAFRRLSQLALQCGWQLELCQGEQRNKLQLTVLGEMLVAPSNDAAKRQIHRDGLQQYGHFNELKQQYKPCVVIFEPNKEIAGFIVGLLQSDYQVLVAPDESTLLDWVKLRQPDLILADALAAKPDGLALIRQLSQDQGSSHIPLFVLSGFKDQQTKTECLSAGAVEYLSKPFHAAEVLLKIRNQIRQQVAFTLLRDKSSYLARLQSEVAARDVRFMQRLEQLVTNHFQHANFTIPMLAGLLGYSERQLQRRCLRTHHCSPTDYIQEFRLQRAKEYLLQGEAISVVADACGYTSEQYFSQCFKKRFGITPAKQRKS